MPSEKSAPIKPLHLSFRDFLVNRNNHKTDPFWVDEKETHKKLAKHCLHVMRGGLRKNICGLSFPGMRRSAVDLGQLEKSMRSQTEVYFKPNDNKEVYNFLTTHFLHWVEAMSLLGRAKECLDSLRSLARWLENCEDSSLSTFVADAVRFLQANFSVVAEAPLQIYCCLAFAPSKTVLRKTLKHAIPKWIENLPKVEENWDARLLTLEGHSNVVNSVVFSHDSKKMASGSLDNTIRIWDAEIGRCEDVISLDRYAGVLSFTPDEHGIVTNRGTFALTGGSQSSAESAMVTSAGKDLLWLPPECRDGKVAVSGSTVVIGCPSGRVVFLGISMADVEQ
ncbi:Vegetative incompatibility protein HET-E-1 [Fusarium culmorum]|uniref:Mitochondrial division protein 1 n=1 Tax=Fusarium culmorum TaxID=5516 RepID=A0A2T4GIR9_FUSCU|nr:Vegetative incompatibility protein HET-E-1 [Fusarium culmorum]